MGSRIRGEIMFLALVLGMYLSATAEATLRVGYYEKTCPHAEFIVKKVITKAVKKDSGLPADFIRMHFHDCFVRFIFFPSDVFRVATDQFLSTPPRKTSREKDSSINNPSLEGFEFIDEAKAKLERSAKVCVSCADIIAFAARDSVELSGGFVYEVPSGRRDGRISRRSETFGNLPPPTFNLSQLTQSFASKGLNLDDLVTLSGTKHINAHSNGPPSPELFDSSYYKNILVHKGLFHSDQDAPVEFQDCSSGEKNAANEYHFKKRFAEAMVKMGKIEVLTGKKGEIRLNCGVTN
ncbi:unnamed protein product [Spirodela intermedia]|uniref:Peroxidase n=1 Tax=Spirodela intermedia TaxID=51605 RepID=A0ABN7ECK5_SPIIN|nr:unnamed protein product [Spirodela intermedia]